MADRAEWAAAVASSNNKLKEATTMATAERAATTSIQQTRQQQTRQQQWRQQQTR